MVYQVDKAPTLSEKNIRTLKQRCIELIKRGACIEQIRTEVIRPVLEFYSTQTPPRTLANDAVYLAWMLLRQGTMLCLLLNNFRSGILENYTSLPEPIMSEEVFGDENARNNIKAFLATCRGELFLTDEQLFPQVSLYTSDTNTLTKAIDLTDSFFSRIYRIKKMDYEATFEQIQLDDCLFSVEDNCLRLSETGTPVNESGAKDLRLCVLKEMLDTEQSYVADLDRLQSYAEELRLDEVISLEAQAGIFANLDALVDFQRRFMLQMEARLSNAILSDVTLSYGCGIGRLFIDNERGFSVYEEFCPNQSKADALISAEAANLTKKASVMEPNVTLRAYLIKPLQRICKYPLLFRELIKHSVSDAGDRDELLEALDICNQIALRVNDRKREEEMTMASNELNSLVKDWKGLDRRHLGKLLLREGANVKMAGESNGKDYCLYLFERNLLIVGRGKSMADLFVGRNNKLSRHQLMIKEKLHPGNMVEAERAECDSEGCLGIKLKFRRGGDEQESWLITFKMEEQATYWIKTLSALILEYRPKEVDKRALNRERRRRTLLSPQAKTAEPSYSVTTISSDSDLRASTGMRPPSMTMGGVPEEMPFRLKITYGEDILVAAIFTDIITLEDLKRVVLVKLEASYRVMGGKLRLAPGQFSLKYYDEQRDLISLLDDTDVTAALTFSPTSLAVKVFPEEQPAHTGSSAHLTFLNSSLAPNPSIFPVSSSTLPPAA